MAGADRMTIEEVVKKVLLDEHADVIREAVEAGRAELMEARGRAPRGAVGSGGVRDLAAGLSQQPGEAEGSPSPELRVRAGAALTTPGRAEHHRIASGPASKTERRNESEPVIEPPQDSTRLQPDGYGLGEAVRGCPRISWATRPPVASTSRCRRCVTGGCVSVTTWPQGESWAPVPSTERQ